MPLLAMDNPNCDGSGPHVAGEVRLMPHSATPLHGNSILCRACWQKENEYRAERNRELATESRYPLIHWTNGKVYEGA